MKLPTKEELWTDWIGCLNGPDSTEVALHAFVGRWVRLAEEEARREANKITCGVCGTIYPAMVGIEHSCRPVESRAAPATAEAGKDCQHRERVEVTGECMECGQFPPPAPAPSKAVTEEPTPMRAGLRGSCPHGYEANVLKCGLCDDEWVERVREIAYKRILEREVEVDIVGTLHPRYAEKRIIELEKKVAALEAALDPQNTGPGIVAARSAAGGKTDIEQAEVRGAVAMAKSIARTLREHGQRDAAKKIEEVLAPAAREGSGA